MKLKGNLSILINRDYTTIEVKDSDASITFLTIELTPEQLSSCLSRLAYVKCELDIRGLDRIGKKHENKSFEFQIPENLKEYEDRKKLGKYSQTLLTDGWISDGSFNSQNSFFTKDNIEYARCTIRRYI